MISVMRQVLNIPEVPPRTIPFLGLYKVSVLQGSAGGELGGGMGGCRGGRLKGAWPVGS